MEIELQLIESDERFWKTISQIQIFFSHMSELQPRISLIHQTQKPLEKYRLHFDVFMHNLPNEVSVLPQTIVNGDDERGYIGIPPQIVEEWGLKNWLK